MSELLSNSPERDKSPTLYPIDVAERADVELDHILDKMVSRDDITKLTERDERTAYILQSTLVGLGITVDTPSLFEDDDGEQWKLDPDKRQIAIHALEVEKSVRAAKNLLQEAEHRFNRREFGDFMWDILEDVERKKSKTDLYRAFQLLRDKQIDRSDLVPAHRIALVMLHGTIDKE